MDKSLLLSAPMLLFNLTRNRRLKQKEILRLQNKKLRRLVKHSYENVYYYHKIFKESHIKPEDIRTIEDLDKVPISKKTDFTSLPLEKITASNIDLKKCHLCRTSGTSGVRLEFYREKKFTLTNLLRHYLWQLEAGDKVFNKHVVIGGGWLPQHVFEKMGIFSSKRISPFEDPETQIKQIIEFDPRAMYALPSSLRILAKELGQKQNEVNINLIFTGGELLDTHTRQLAKKTFDAEVFDSYGMTEVAGISNECCTHTDTQHICSNQVIVESVQNGNKTSIGKQGDLVVTGLVNYATPFIRYNTEDTGILIDDECACGSHFPLMKITEGRKSDTILLEDGRIISAHVVCVGLRDIQGIKQLQVTQESIGHFIIKVVKERGFTNSTREDIIRSLKQSIGEVDVEVLIVDNIPRLESGKFKMFITKLH